MSTSMFIRKSSPVRPVGRRGAAGVVLDDERPRGAPVDLCGPFSAQQGPLELRDHAPERGSAAPSEVDRYVREILIPHLGIHYLTNSISPPHMGITLQTQHAITTSNFQARRTRKFRRLPPTVSRTSESWRSLAKSFATNK